MLKEDDLIPIYLYLMNLVVVVVLTIIRGFRFFLNLFNMFIGKESHTHTHTHTHEKKVIAQIDR